MSLENRINQIAKDQKPNAYFELKFSIFSVRRTSQENLLDELQQFFFSKLEKKLERFAVNYNECIWLALFF